MTLYHTPSNKPWHMDPVNEVNHLPDASEEAEILGEMVRHHRETLGLSLRQAAVEAGVSFSTLSRTEHHQPPSFESFVLIARWLKLDILK